MNRANVESRANLRIKKEETFSFIRQAITGINKA